jgi:hypothetical protein
VALFGKIQAEFDLWGATSPRASAMFIQSLNIAEAWVSPFFDNQPAWPFLIIQAEFDL